MRGYDWPPESISLLIKLHAEGLSASLIAKGLNREFRTKLSRGSVIGKLNRLNIHRAQPSAPRKAEPYPPNRKSSRPRAHLHFTKTREPIVLEHDPHERPDTAKPFWERREGECWWPFGEGADQHSCCRPVDRQGLCTVHCEIGLQRFVNRQPGNAQELERSVRRWL